MAVKMEDEDQSFAATPTNALLGASEFAEDTASLASSLTGLLIQGEGVFFLQLGLIRHDTGPCDQSGIGLTGASSFCGY
jgi:hypothetical protein